MPQTPDQDATLEGLNPETAAQLRSFIERIERLEEERKGLANDVKDLFSEAKSAGFDPKAMKAAIRLRAQDPGEREEVESMIDLYMSVLEA